MFESTGGPGNPGPVHVEVRELVARHGPSVIADPAAFRAAFEDVLGNGSLPPGTVNLLVDAVRHQVAGHVVSLVDAGATPTSAVRTAGARFAEVRGGGDAAQCTWASAVLGHATGRVPESVVVACIPAGRPFSAGAPPADVTRPAPVPAPYPSLPQPTATTRRHHLLRTAGAVGLVLLLLVAAGVGWRIAGDDDGAQGRDRGAGAGSPDDGDGTVQQAAAATGTLFADPGAIRPFADPAVEIQDDRDLVDYVLPGLTGSGADCLAERIDVDEVLASRTADGAAAVADLILACVASDEIGKVFGMYAVGFEDDGRSRYADLAVCVTDGFSDLDRNRTEPSLVLVLDERLDLASGPTSRQVAADQIAELTTCSTEAPEEPSDASAPPQNQRVIRWDLLHPGDCLIDLAEDPITTVSVVDCRTPHRLEVVGATFSGSDEDPGTLCKNLYAHYTGKQLAASDHRLEHLQSAPGSLSLRLVCLATAADRGETTGSIR